MPEPRRASKLTVDRCRNPDCACGHVLVELLDEAGECFAIANFDADDVDAICAALIEARDALRARTDQLAEQGNPDAIDARDRRRLIQ